MAGKYTSKLQGKRVLVIGGTSGLGFCIAEAALEHGATVIVASSRQTSIDDAIARLTTSYPELAPKNLSGHTVDLKSDDAEASIIALLDFATNNKTTPLDHVTDTAGDTLAIKPLAEVDLEYILDSQRVRWISTLFLAKHLKSDGYMTVAASSSYTLTGGVNSHQPRPNWFLPAGIGSGKEGLMRGFAVELRPIRVNLVAPGAVLTELFSRNFQGDQLKKVVDSYTAATLTGEMGRPEDLAEAYIYCMKDKFLTGQVILSEGGLLLAPGAQG